MRRPAYSLPSINFSAVTQKVEVDNWISLRDYYRIADNLLKQVANYRSIYSYTIKHVPSIGKPVELITESVNMETPLTKRLAGRPKVNRYKGNNEVKRLLECERCKKFAGHNR